VGGAAALRQGRDGPGRVIGRCWAGPAARDNTKERFRRGVGLRARGLSSDEWSGPAGKGPLKRGPRSTPRRQGRLRGGPSDRFQVGREAPRRAGSRLRKRENFSEFPGAQVYRFVRVTAARPSGGTSAWGGRALYPRGKLIRMVGGKGRAMSSLVGGHRQAGKTGRCWF